jgi:integrase
MSLLQQTCAQIKVREFLDGVARNSHQSEKTYGIGLVQFQRFLYDKFPNQNRTPETIIERLISNEINVYNLLDDFVSFLLNENLSANSISIYMTAIKSYLAYYDIDIVSSKFKRKVRLPKNRREDEEPLDASDIRKILLSGNNRRLKPFLLFLASGGMRAMEASALRIKDIDFSVSPTKVHIRKEYAKTRVGRDVYVSDEATKFLKEWLDWKYRDRRRQRLTPIKSDDDLIFSKAKFGKKELVQSQVQHTTTPQSIYQKIRMEFNSILKIVKMDERKEGMIRRKVTLHSFRRLLKTVVSTQVNQDYSEWFLGHAKSPYWTMKEGQRREIYATKCMKYLTFLDYSGLETTGKNIESKLEEKDREIAYLRHRDKIKEDLMASLSDKVLNLSMKVDELMKNNKKS